MKLILLNMSSQFEWDNGIYNRNKHILDELIKRSDVTQVLSVDFLPYDFRSFLRLYLKSKIYKKTGKNVVAAGCHYVARKSNDKVISLSAKNMHLVKKAAFKLGFKDAIILNYNPLNSEYIELFKHNKKYFDAVDNWINNSIFTNYKSILEKNYKNIVANSDHVFTVSNKLKDELTIISNGKPPTETAAKFLPNNNKIKCISNGVDLDYYKNPIASERLEKITTEIRKTYKMIVGYMGVIRSDRVDSDLLEHIVENNPNCFFIMAGIIQGNYEEKRFNHYKNIAFIGEIKYTEMPFLYEQFDICMIPHLVNDFIKSMDPKKLYEYLASGKPVITTAVSGTEKFKSYIKIATNKEEFSKEISVMLNDKENFTEKKITERRKLVEEYGWKNKVDEIINIIYQSLPRFQ